MSHATGFFIYDNLSPNSLATVKFCEEEDKNGDKWREFEGKCYHVSEDSESDGKANWWEARKRCIDKGADLVSIHSSHENDFIQELIKESWGNTFWIGYHELSFTEYAWTDGTPNDYNLWRENEPNDNYGAEKCVAIYRRGALPGRWKDELCVIKRGYICKKREGSMPPPTLPTEVDGVCPDGFKSERFSKRCYYYSGDDQKETWEDANKACQKKYKQAELATIGGSIDQAFVTLLVEESNADDMWIGFHCNVNLGLFGDNCEWVWIDDSVDSFTHWGLNRPQKTWTRPDGENCVVVQRITENVAAIGTWDHAACNEKKPYLCQALRVPGSGEDKNPFEDQYNTAKCTGDDSFLYHGRCYTFYDTNMTWTVARDICKQKGSELPVLMDTFEGARLNYEAYSDGEHTKFWTDVRFEKDLYKFVWGKDRDVQVTPWDSDEPDESLDDSCVAYLDGHWYNDPCSEEKPFFCVDGDYNVDDSTKPDPSDLHCESPEDEPYGNKCYWIPEKKISTWSSANEQCKGKGMTLASIHSLDEAKFINDLLEETRGDEKNAWIGFESGPIGACRWSDGSPVNFLYWDQFKQNSSSLIWGDPKDCVEMILDKEGKWNRRLCQDKLAFVCSKNKVVGKPVKADTSTGVAGESQQPDKTDTDDTPQAAKPDTDDTPQVAKPDTDDTPQAVKPDTGDTPQAAKPDKGDTPQAAKPDTGDTPQAAKPDTDDTPQAAKPDTGDTPQATKPDADDTPQAAKPDTNDTSQAAKPDDDTPQAAKPDTGDTPQAAKPDTDDTSQAAKPDDDTPQGDNPDSQDQGHSDQDDGNQVSPKDDRIDGDGRQDNQKTRDDGKTGQMSGGAIAGVVFGVLAVLALVLVAVFLVRRRGTLWRLESILRGNDSSDGVAFHNTVYSEGNDGGVVNFGQSA